MFEKQQIIWSTLWIYYQSFERIGGNQLSAAVKESGFLVPTQKSRRKFDKILEGFKRKRTKWIENWAAQTKSRAIGGHEERVSSSVLKDQRREIRSRAQAIRPNRRTRKLAKTWHSTKWTRMAAWFWTWRVIAWANTLEDHHRAQWRWTHWRSDPTNRAELFVSN